MSRARLWLYDTAGICARWRDRLSKTNSKQKRLGAASTLESGAWAVSTGTSS